MQLTPCTLQARTVIKISCKEGQVPHACLWIGECKQLDKELGETAKTVALQPLSPQLSQTVLLQDVSFKTFNHQSGNICRSSVLAATSPWGRFKWIFGEISNTWNTVNKHDHQL